MHYRQESPHLAQTTRELWGTRVRLSLQLPGYRNLAFRGCRAYFRGERTGLNTIGKNPHISRKDRASCGAPGSVIASTSGLSKSRLSWVAGLLPWRADRVELYRQKSPHLAQTTRELWGTRVRLSLQLPGYRNLAFRGCLAYFRGADRVERYRQKSPHLAQTTRELWGTRVCFVLPTF
jgi:hypothetical protein